MKETVTVNGVDLDAFIVPGTQVRGVDGTSGLFTVPAKRNTNVVIAGAHGARYVPAKRYQPATLVMPMWIRGVDVDGCVPSDPSARLAFYANLRALVTLFTSGEQVVIRHTLTDGSAREITASLDDVLDFTIDGAGSQTRGRVSVGLTAANPFWSDLATTTSTFTLTTGQSATLSEFAAASAPMDDVVVTFSPGTNPVLTQPSTGIFVGYSGPITAGRKLVIDTTGWTASGTVDAGGTWLPATPPTQHIARISHGRYPRLFSLTPQTPAPVLVLTHTGGGSMTVSVTAYQRHLVS